jgi:hypothetical protein
MIGMRVPFWLKLGWTFWVGLWLPIYWRQYGTQNFLQFCDLGNLLIMFALWSESALIFSWQAVGLLLFQTLYIIDLAGAFFTGHHPIGGTEYMFNPSIPLFIRMLSLFHLVTPPLLLWSLYRLGYDKRAWKYATVTTWVVILINYFWRPWADVNWARGFFYHQQHSIPALLYLAIYLSLVPVIVYWPTHLLLRSWADRTGHVADRRNALFPGSLGHRL